ncbi:MAG: hypothetical protein WKF96_21145, partial [Solirubrobacteraceae bacterium]
MRARLTSEQGFSIAIAMMLMSMMLSVGLVSFAYVDTGQEQSRVERVDESAFNLSEGTLNAQAFVLSRHWPATSARTYQPCSQATAPTAYCPQPTEIAASFDSVDYQTGNPTWTTTVHDDDGSEFYDDVAIPTRPSYDANDNGKVWVRAEATFTVGPRAGRSRTVVALVRVEEIAVGAQFPARTVIAGKFRTTNKGNKVIVDTQSTETSPHPITVRCADTNSDSCLEYARNHPQQISPPGSFQGGQYVGQPAISAATQRSLKEKAQTDGTYYATGCPPTLQGAVVWVETASCSYSGNSKYNSPAAPGIVVFGSGKLSLAGSTEFYGVIYMLNTLNRTDIDLLGLGGNTQIFGRIFVDGDAGVSA